MGAEQSSEVQLLQRIADAKELHAAKVATANKSVPPALFTIVERFLEDGKLVLYGGTALHLLVGLRGARIYGPDEKPDYDCFSDDAFNASHALADILYRAGEAAEQKGDEPEIARWTGVTASIGVHFGTFKVRVYGADAADISYVPPPTLAKIRAGARSVVIPSAAAGQSHTLLVTNEFVLASNIYHELSNPTGNPERWAKVVPRLAVLANAYQFARYPVDPADSVAPAASPNGRGSYDPTVSRAVLDAVRRAHRGPPTALLFGHALVAEISRTNYTFETVELLSPNPTQFMLNTPLFHAAHPAYPAGTMLSLRYGGDPFYDLFPMYEELIATYPASPGGAGAPPVQHVVLRGYEVKTCAPFALGGDGMALASREQLLYWLFRKAGIDFAPALAPAQQTPATKAWIRLLQLTLAAPAPPPWKNCLGDVHALADVFDARGQFKIMQERARTAGVTLDVPQLCRGRPENMCGFPCIFMAPPINCTTFPSLEVYSPRREAVKQGGN